MSLRSSAVCVIMLSACAVVFTAGGRGPDARFTGPAYRNPSLPVADRVDDLLARMTLDEKVGQMTQADHSFLKSPDDVATYFLGSVLSGGNSEIADVSPRGWAAFVGGLQKRALTTRLAIPILYGIDAVHGHNNVRGAVIFPHNIGLGCTRNPKMVEEAARITAQEVAATGMHWTFAPCVAVPQDERWGRTYEGFGESPALVAELGAAAVRGLQGDDLSRPGSVLASAKHYVGDGGTKNGVDQGDTQVDEATLRKVHLPGYVAAIKAGAGTVMASFNSWNGQKLHGHKYLLTHVLKGELGFKGFVVSDWKAIEQLPGDYAQQIEKSIDAGIDMVMVPDIYPAFFETLKTLVQDGRLPMSRIDDAVRRILTVKFQMGLFERPFGDPSLLAAGRVGRSPRRRPPGRARVARPAREPEQGPAAFQDVDARPRRRQGRRRHRPPVRRMDDRLAGGARAGSRRARRSSQAVRKAAPGGRGRPTRRRVRRPTGARAAVVVIGEPPYAEGQGDRTSLELDPADVAVVKKVKAAGLPTIVVLFSGRPMILDPILPTPTPSWRRGCRAPKGDGVADVLFGRYKPTGKLSHTWPRSMAQIPINVGPNGEKPAEPGLFEFGFGLSYR